MLSDRRSKNEWCNREKKQAIVDCQHQNSPHSIDDNKLDSFKMEIIQNIPVAFLSFSMLENIKIEHIRYAVH